MSSRLPILFTLTALSGTTYGATSGTFSDWQSTDGRVMRAKVVSINHEARTAVFKRDDGQEFTIAFTQFSKTDAARLASVTQLPKEPEVRTTQAKSAALPSVQRIPNRVELDDVPMIIQKFNYCVPASAAMIAQFHEIDTDQDQIAQLSSAASENNRGTNPGDMLRAMEKLGFTGKSLFWQEEEDYVNEALPKIKQALSESNPVYVSYRPGVFGEMGHGCVIVGYNDRKQEFLIHNPWGNVFTESYVDLQIKGGGVLLIEPPSQASTADEAFIVKIEQAIPQLDGNIINLIPRLKASGISHEMIWCSRADSRNDLRFAKDTSRGHGRQILELSFERNSAVIITESDAGETTAYLFVTRPNEGAQFVVRRIDASGWSAPSHWTLGRLTRSWPTRFLNQDGEEIWELPMIELHPSP